MIKTKKFAHSKYLVAQHECVTAFLHPCIFAPLR